MTIRSMRSSHYYHAHPTTVNHAKRWHSTTNSSATSHYQSPYHPRPFLYNAASLAAASTSTVPLKQQPPQQQQTQSSQGLATQLRRLRRRQLLQAVGMIPDPSAMIVANNNHKSPVSTSGTAKSEAPTKQSLLSKGPPTCSSSVAPLSRPERKAIQTSKADTIDTKTRIIPHVDASPATTKPASRPWNLYVGTQALILVVQMVLLWWSTTNRPTTSKTTMISTTTSSSIWFSNHTWSPSFSRQVSPCAASCWAGINSREPLQCFHDLDEFGTLCGWEQPYHC